jgi:hypothetical protein
LVCADGFSLSIHYKSVTINVPHCCADD